MSAFAPTRPDFLEALHPCNSADYGAENDGSDNHLYKLDERLAEWLQTCPELREKMAGQDACKKSENHPAVERFVEWLAAHGHYAGRYCCCGHDISSRD